MTRPRIIVLTRHDAPLAVARGTRETVESLPPPGWPLLAVLLISFAIWALIAVGGIAFWLEVLR